MVNEMKNLVLGLTGQSGAGNATLSQYVKENGFAVIDADQIARQVVEKGTNCIAEVVLEFGCEYLNVEGGLNRKKLAQNVFTDKAKLKKLNAIMFPYIINRIEEEIKALRSSFEGVIVLDAPTLFESGADRFCNYVVSVVAPEEVRCRRIIARDNLTLEEAQTRIHAQHSEEYYTGRSWYVVHNDGDKEDLKMQVGVLVSRLKELLEQEGPKTADTSEGGTV